MTLVGELPEETAEDYRQAIALVRLRICQHDSLGQSRIPARTTR